MASWRCSPSAAAGVDRERAASVDQARDRQPRGRLRPAAGRPGRARRRDRGAGARRRGAGGGRGRAGRRPRRVRCASGPGACRRPSGRGRRGPGRAGGAAAVRSTGPTATSAGWRRGPPSLRAKLDRLDRRGGRGRHRAWPRPGRRGRTSSPAVEAARRRREAAETTARAAEQRREAAQAERHAWTARREALALALDEARARAGAERLAAVEGVVGTLLDLVDDRRRAGRPRSRPHAARRWPPSWSTRWTRAGGRCSVLADGRRAGAVLALGAAAGHRVRRRRSASRCWPTCGPGGPRWARCWPELLGAAVVVDGGWEAALDAALAHPDAVVVTPRGRPLRRHAAGGSAPPPPAPRAPRSTRPGRGPRPRSPLPSAATADHHTAPRRRSTRPGGSRKPPSAGSTRPTRRWTRPTRRTRTVRGRPRRHRRRTGDPAASSRPRPPSSWPATARRADELAAVLPELEAEEASLRARAASHGRGPAPARRAGRPRWRPDADRSRQASHRPGRPTGLPAHAGSAEVEERLAGSVEARRQAESPSGRARRRRAGPRPAGSLRRRPARVGRRAVGRGARAPATRDRRPAGAVGASSTACARERTTEGARLAELRERAQRAEIDEAEVRLRLEQAIELCRTQLDIEPDAAVRRRGAGADRRRHPHGAGARPRAGAAGHGPDQPAGARGVRGPVRAPHLPVRAARRRQGAAAASSTR